MRLPRVPKPLKTLGKNIIKTGSEEADLQMGLVGVTAGGGYMANKMRKRKVMNSTTNATTKYKSK